MFLLLYWKVIPPETLSQQFWKFSEQTKETLVVESVFCIVIGGWIWQLEFCKKNATKDVFLVIFQYFHNSSFSNILSKIHEEIFFRSV